MTSFISHTALDCGNAYELSEWWKQVLEYVDKPDDPNEPGHEECWIQRPDGGHPLLFIEVPEAKQVKNRIHFDLRPNAGTRDEEVAAARRARRHRRRRPQRHPRPRHRLGDHGRPGGQRVLRAAQRGGDSGHDGGLSAGQPATCQPPAQVRRRQREHEDQCGHHEQGQPAETSDTLVERRDHLADADRGPHQYHGGARSPPRTSAASHRRDASAPRLRTAGGDHEQSRRSPASTPRERRLVPGQDATSRISSRGHHPDDGTQQRPGDKCAHRPTTGPSSRCHCRRGKYDGPASSASVARLVDWARFTTPLPAPAGGVRGVPPPRFEEHPLSIAGLADLVLRDPVLAEAMADSGRALDARPDRSGCAAPVRGQGPGRRRAHRAGGRRDRARGRGPGRGAR